jgi:tetratricopeptide (TPR) repeat protein
MAEIVVHNSGEKKVRVLLAIAVVAALVFAWFSVRWLVGNMLAELTSVEQPNVRDVAEFARRLAPADPLPVWLAANIELQDFTDEGAERSVNMLEDVVRRSPYDYRWWIELGRAKEQAEDAAGAEAAFRRALDLAPEYTFARWQFGNFLLRQGRTEEAFAELRRTTEKSAVYREQVFSLAWDYFDKDPERLESLAANTPDVRANLALFYAVRGSSKDSLRMWNSLTDDQKIEHLPTARVIAQGLHDKKFFRQALEFAKQTGIDAEATQETVSNGGFEHSLGKPEDTLFGWRLLRTDGRVDIGTDSSIKKEGSRSLKVAFRTYTRLDFNYLGQVVTTEPSTRYRLSYWVRTETLRSGGTPFIEILNGMDDTIIAASSPIAAGTADWLQVTIDFTTPENCEGIVIRTSRAYCGEECPIVGTLWFDDFVLQRL